MKNLTTEEEKNYTFAIKALVHKCLVKAGNINQLALKTGLTRLTIYRLLDGKPHNKVTIIKLQEFYNDGK